MGRRNKRRWLIRFRNLNQRILGLNILWGWWNKAVTVSEGIHWKCAGLDFKLLCRKILWWPNEPLIVPASMPSFAAVTYKKGMAYAELNPAMIEVNEVRAELVALPKEPPTIIPILSLLPEGWKNYYEKEENLVENDHLSWVKMRECKPRLGMKRGEYVKMIKRLLQLCMIILLPVEEVRVINGLHCVTKDASKQRLIFDGRSVNHVLLEPNKVSLPDFSMLSDWEVRQGKAIRFGKLDLDNFYHRLGVPGWLVPYLSLPTVKGKQLGRSEGIFSLVCCTLPMGLCHSVLLAQLAHLSVLSKVSLAPHFNIRVEKDESKWVMLYIDDVIIAAKATTGEKASKEVNEVINQCLECYNDVGLIINEAKLVWATSDIVGLGCTFSKRACGISPKKERIKQIVGATRYMLTLEVISPKSIEFLLGHWTWFVLLYRPLYAVFFHVYKWLHAEEKGFVRRLWKSAKQEFSLVITFADIYKLTWKRKTAPVVLAMDASLQGASACEIQWNELIDRRIFEDDILLKDKGVWEKILNREWEKLQHINILEMRALTMSLVSRITCLKFFGMRCKIFSESTVVVGGVKKENKLGLKVARRFTVGLASSTVRTYVAAIANFKGKVGIIRFDDLDAQLLDYVQSFPHLFQRSTTERIGCACRHFFPEVAGTLLCLNRFTHQLRRQYRSLSKPPMIWDVVVLVVFQLVSIGFPITALGALLQYDCFLRPIELAGIQTRHIAFPGGVFLGSKARKVLLLLPRAKSGPLQSVRIESKLVLKLLLKVVKKNSLDTLLFPSTSVYRHRLAKALQRLDLGHIGYTPHSIRHGAVTMDLINKGEKALPSIMFRGRWESSAGKSYLQMGAAALLYAEIPRKLIRKVKKQEKILLKIFRHLDWTPLI